MKIFRTLISVKNQFKNFAKVRKEIAKFHKDFLWMFLDKIFTNCVSEKFEHLLQQPLQYYSWF